MNNKRYIILYTDGTMSVSVIRPQKEDYPQKETRFFEVDDFTDISMICSWYGKANPSSFGTKIKEI